LKRRLRRIMNNRNNNNNNRLSQRAKDKLKKINLNRKMRLLVKINRKKGNSECR